MELLRTPLYMDANLAAYWPLNINSTDLVVGNNGVDTAITYPSLGFSPGSARFNGTTSQIQVGDASALKPTGTISLVAWIYIDSAGVGLHILRKGREAANQTRYAMFVDSSDRLQFRVVAGSGRAEGSGASSVPSGELVHCATVCNINGGTNATIYINGVSQSTSVIDSSSGTYTNVAETNSLGIGADSTGGSKHPGNIFDAALFNRGLTAAEVALLASKPTSPAMFF